MSETTAQGIPPKGLIRELNLLGSKAIPFGRSKLRAEVKAGRFPAPKVLSARVVAYSCEAVHKWIADQEAAPTRAVLGRRVGATAEAAL